MMIWLGAMLMALLFGVAVSYWSFKYAWVLVALNSYAVMWARVAKKRQDKLQ